MPMQWREVKIVSANDEHVNKYFFDNLFFFFLSNIQVKMARFIQFTTNHSTNIHKASEREQTFLVSDHL